MYTFHDSTYYIYIYICVYTYVIYILNYIHIILYILYVYIILCVILYIYIYICIYSICIYTHIPYLPLDAKIGWFPAFRLGKAPGEAFRKNHRSFGVKYSVYGGPEIWFL